MIVFFVLSGYVISYVADTRETTPRRFLVARFARLWSVLVPAMVLTVLCDAVGRHWGVYHSAYVNVPADLPVVRIGAALGFVSESWVSIQPLSNGATWSLCVEFWYYMLFAAWTFAPPGRARAVLVGAAALAAGAKAILLMPLWLFGVALQRSRALRRLGDACGPALWAAGLLLVATVLATHAYNTAIAAMQRGVSPFVFRQLAEARVFWFDWLLGLAVAAHLLGARRMAMLLPLERVAPLVRWAAGASFAAYLFHVPLLHLCAAFMRPDYGWPAILCTLTVIATLGRIAERSKAVWRHGLDRLAGRLERIYSPPVLPAAS